MTSQGTDPEQRAAAERRDEPGLDDGRLADPGRSHDRHEASVADRPHELVDERTASVEVVGVRLVERPQALVRVLGGRVRLGHRGPDRSGERGEKSVDRLVALVRIGRGCAGDDLVERSRQLGPDRAQRR